jgi:TonB family protein
MTKTGLLVRVAQLCLVTASLTACSSENTSGRLETVAPTAGQESAVGSEVTIAEETALRIAEIKPYPTYPQTAIDAKLQGHVIVKISTDASGTVRTVNVLESTDASFKESVELALNQWRLRPLRAKNLKNPPSPITATLAFYFKLRDGKAFVSPGSELSASEQ